MAAFMKGVMKTRNFFAEQALSGEDKLFLKAANKVADILNSTKDLFDPKYFEVGINSRVNDKNRPNGERECLKVFQATFLNREPFDMVKTAFNLRHVISDGKATQNDLIVALKSVISTAISSLDQQHLNNQPIANHRLITNGLSAIKKYIELVTENPSQESIDKEIKIKDKIEPGNPNVFNGLDDLIQQIKTAIKNSKSPKI